jgi:hypothetical protein
MKINLLLKIMFVRKNFEEISVHLTAMTGVHKSKSNTIAFQKSRIHSLKLQISIQPQSQENL